MKQYRIAAQRGRNPNDLSDRGKSNGNFVQILEIGENISNALTSVQKDNMIIEFNESDDIPTCQD